MADATTATTDYVTMDSLDTLFIESVETIRYSKEKRPDERTIHDILGKDRNLTELKLSGINDRLAFLIKEEKIKSQPSKGKNFYFTLNSSLDTSHESMSETDNATPTTTTCLCANDLNSMKDHMSGLNTEITAKRSFVLEQMITLKR